VHGKRAVRHIVFDTNHWKSFVHAQFTVSIGDRERRSLSGKPPEHHRMFAAHLTAKYRMKTEGRGRTINEWRPCLEWGDS
jgi:hypothetical protein